MARHPLQDLIVRYQSQHDAICDLFERTGVPPQDAEQLLLYMAGVSAGIRQVSIKGDWVQAACLGWQLGAAEGDL